MHEYAAASELVNAASRAAHDTDLEVRVDATRFLAKNASQQTLQPLLDVLANTPGANLQPKVDSRDSLRGAIAADAIVEIGEAAVPGLTHLLESDDASVRWRAALCLKKISTPETLHGLLEAFHDDSPDVAWIGADGLLLLGPAVQISVLRSVLTRPVMGVTLRALRHYAEHSAPYRLFKPIVDATSGAGTSSAALLAVEKVLETLEGKP
jgi:HEAT repeat protein